MELGGYLGFIVEIGFYVPDCVIMVDYMIIECVNACLCV